MPIRTLDAHVHCGRQDRSAPQDYETIAALHREAGVEAAWMFPPVYEVYDRYAPDFDDTAGWRRRRKRAGDYLLELAARDIQPRVFPFFFVWNDFDLEALASGPWRGIKWHRHPDEPVYRYDDPRCRALLDHIVERRLPVVLEESFENTMGFLDDLAPEAVVVIPHCGSLNGGFCALDRAGVWRRPHVYADASALSDSPRILRLFLDAYGPGKLLYGSDYPFDTPAACLAAVRALGLRPADEALILAANALRLLGEPLG